MERIVIYEAKILINNKRYIGQTINNFKYRKMQHIDCMKNYRDISPHFYRSLRKYGLNNFKWYIIDTADNQNDLNNKESFWIEFFQTTNPKFGYNLKGGGAYPFLTDEVKYKIGKAQKGKLNHMYGKRGGGNPSSKSVININTNEKFDCVSDLCRKYPNFSVSKVCAVCRGDRKTTNGYTFRYLDSNGNIIENNNAINIKYLINYMTNEKFIRSIDAFNKYKRKGQDSSTLYAKLKKNNGICLWNKYIWYYSDFNIKSFDLNILYKKCIYTNNKPIINLTTGVKYHSIKEATKYPANLANSLRKNKGHCFYNKEEWKII